MPVKKKRQAKSSAQKEIERALRAAAKASTENKKASELDTFSGTNGCTRCGFDGPILSKYSPGAIYERPDGTILKIEGEHLVRQCQWCLRPWIEQCKNSVSPTSTLAEQNLHGHNRDSSYG